MNFIKRACISVKQKRVKGLILFILLFVIVNLILAGLSIENATHKASELARQKLGSTVTLEYNMEAAMEGFQMGRGGMGGFGGMGASTQLRQPITMDMANELAELEHVIGYNYISSGTAFTEGFDYFTTSVEEEVDQASIQETMGSRGLGNIGGMGRVIPEITLEGHLFTELATDFFDGVSQLIEGRHIREEDIEEPYILVEKRIAEINELQVGDKVNLKDLSEEETIEFEIIGIYETTKIQEQELPFDIPIMNPYNTMYVSYVYANKFKTNIFQNEGSTIEGIDRAIYFMDDPIHVDIFKEQALKTDIDFEVFKLDANDSLFQQMTGPINNVASLSKNVVLLVFIAGALILALVLMLNMKERTYEIGVLLSLGESKLKIAGQMFIEVLIIATISFVIAIFSGGWIAQTIGNELIEREASVIKIEENQGQQQRDFITRIRGARISQPQQEVDPITEIDVGVTPDALQRLGFLGFVIILFGTSVPVASILRYQPKTILTRNI